ncbi:uncharacterized protein METZ01_LOCUS431589, partial [marine metagenome]
MQRLLHLKQFRLRWEGRSLRIVAGNVEQPALVDPEEAVEARLV